MYTRRTTENTITVLPSHKDFLQLVSEYCADQCIYVLAYLFFGKDILKHSPLR
jgi:hypothetical protein